MTALAPARYALEPNQTAFPFEDVAVAVGYEIEPARRLASERRAAVTVTLANSAGIDEKARGEYSVPKDGRIGRGLPLVEEQLYRVADESIRTFAQLQSLDKARQAVADLEEALGEGDTVPAKPEARPAAVEAFSDALIRALIYVTNVTSISREGLDAFRAGPTALVPAPNQTPTVVPRAAALAQHLELAPDADLRQAQALMLDHLVATEPSLGADHAAFVLDHFVPRYLQLRQELGRLPKSLWDHAFSSLWQGGLTGWITLSVIGEAVVNNVLGLAVDIPGFWIGSATAVLWPYLRRPFGIARQRAEVAELVAETDRKLALPTASRRSLRELAERRRTRWAEEAHAGS